MQVLDEHELLTFDVVQAQGVQPCEMCIQGERDAAALDAQAHYCRDIQMPDFWIQFPNGQIMHVVLFRKFPHISNISHSSLKKKKCVFFSGIQAVRLFSGMQTLFDFSENLRSALRKRLEDSNQFAWRDYHRSLTAFAILATTSLTHSNVLFLVADFIVSPLPALKEEPVQAEEEEHDPFAYLEESSRSTSSEDSANSTGSEKDSEDEEQTWDSEEEESSPLAGGHDSLVDVTLMGHPDVGQVRSGLIDEDYFQHLQDFLRRKVTVVHPYRCSTCRCENRRRCTHSLTDENSCCLEVSVFGEKNLWKNSGFGKFLGFKMEVSSFPLGYRFGQPGQPILTVGVIKNDLTYDHFYDPATDEAALFHFLCGGLIAQKYVPAALLQRFRIGAVKMVHQFLESHLQSDIFKVIRGLDTQRLTYPVQFVFL